MSEYQSIIKARNPLAYYGLDDQDEFISFDVLCLNFDGEAGDNVFVDQASGKGAATVEGGAVISTAQKKFGNGSLLLNGANQLIKWDSHADWNISGDFTLEGWFRLSALPPSGTWATLFAWHNAVANQGWRLIVGVAGQLHWSTDAGGNNGFLVNAGITTGQWYHIAVTNEGGVLKAWLDGALIATDNGWSFTPPTNEPFRIGATSDGDWEFNGFVDSVRLTKGAVRYTDNFTPPTEPFSTAEDLSGNGRHANLWRRPTVGQNPLIHESQGGKSFLFDGVSKALEKYDDAFNTSVYSVEAWIKPQNLPAGTTPQLITGVAEAFGSSNTDKLLMIDQNGNLKGYVYDGAQKWVTGSTVLSTGNAYHVAMVVDGSTMKLYVNGREDGSLAASGSFVGYATPALLIGGKTAGTSTTTNHFDGFIDEVAVYDRALTLEEISESYAYGYMAAGYARAVHEDRPVAYWRLGETSGVTAVDETGNYDLTYVNGPTMGHPSLLPQDSDKAVLFNGIDQYAVRNEADFRAADSQGSIELWFSATTISANSALFGSADTDLPFSSIYFYLFVTPAGEVYLSVRDDTNRNEVKTAGGFNDGNPHHLVITSDGASWEIWIDGVSQGLTVNNGANNGNWFADIDGTRESVSVGALVRGAVGGLFQGTIDEVAVYDYPLTPQQIAKHYAWGMMTGYERAVRASAPVAYWRLGETTGLTAEDEIGNYDLTYVGPPTLGADSLVTVETDKAVTFNGTDQYASRSVANFRGGDSQGSIEFWFSVFGLTATHTVFASGDSDTLSYVSSRLLSTGEVALIQRSNDTHDYVKSVNTFDDGNPHHAVIISNGSSCSIFVDGEEQSLTIINGANTGDWFADSANRDIILIGADRYSSTTANYFNGTIDEVAIYDYALSAEEVAAHYRAATTVYEFSIQGSVMTAAGVAADKVCIFGWDSCTLATTVIPNSDGSWGAMLDPGQYGITYIAEGCQPVTHGPYTVE